MVCYNGKVLIFLKGSSIDSSGVIRVREGRLYRTLKQLTQAIVHNDINPLSFDIEDMLTFTINLCQP